MNLNRSASIFLLIAFFSLSLYSPNSFARKVYFYIGGGESSPYRHSSNSVFDSFLRDARYSTKIAAQKGYEIHSLFDGSHFEFNNQIQTIFKNNLAPFNQNSLKEKIDYFTKQIAENKIKRGDQFLIEINSHGAPRGKLEVSHSIETSDRGLYTSLDILIEFRNQLEGAGIKLAIIDNSCFSGASLTLSSDKTCVITATNQYTPALAEFSSDFWEKASKNQTSFQELFLSAREITAKRGGRFSKIGKLPQISTAIHNYTKDFMDFLFPNDFEVTDDPEQLKSIENFILEYTRKLGDLTYEGNSFVKLAKLTLSDAELSQLLTLINKRKESALLKEEINQLRKQIVMNDSGFFSPVGSLMDFCIMKPEEIFCKDDTKVKSATNTFKLLRSKMIKAENIANEIASDIYFPLSKLYTKFYKIEKNNFKSSPCDNFQL